MAIDQSLICPADTESFVLKNPKFYSTKIPLGHWQLRHLIANPEPDLLYYVSRQDVYCLNTARNLRTHIAVLPFAARCTAVGYGFMCVAGGDKNHVAIVRLQSPQPSIPLEFGSPSPNPPSVKIEQLGSDIVNSISIHKLQGSSEAGITSDVVAVLTNNDKTVRIFSLTQHTRNTVLDLSFAVNHATISPDGRTLVVVGDYQEAYFFERRDLKPSPDFKSTRYVSAHCLWEPLNVVKLHVPKPAVVAGYFTTAWSPSGRLCSVSSELGYVSILDIEALKESEKSEDGEAAIVAIIPSTRPDTAIGPGGVRTSAFSPHPWDLFVWSEDQGRVCLADLRSGLSTRQVLHLDPELEGLRHIQVEEYPKNPYTRGIDADLDAELLRLLHRPHGPDEDLDAYLSIERRRVARTNRRAGEDALTSQERQIVEALGTTTNHEDRLSRSPAPRSIYYGPSGFSTESRHSIAQQSSDFSQDFPGLARNNESATMTEANTLPSAAPTMLASEYFRNRTVQDSLDRTPPFYSPRRQASILIGSDDSDSLAGNASRTTTISSRHPPLPPHLRPSSTSFPDWARLAERSNVERSLHIPRRTSPPPAGETNPEIIERRRRAAIRARERAFTQRESERLERQQQTHQLSLLEHARSNGQAYDRSLGLRTAGLAISWDGRKIWAACDKGIFEYEVNVKGRMVLPAVEMK